MREMKAETQTLNQAFKQSKLQSQPRMQQERSRASDRAN